jgi:hypothetical protein
MKLNEGSQNILIRKNNDRSEQFNQSYNNIIARLKEEFSSNNFIINDDNDNALDKTDKTVNILYLLSNIDEFYIDNLTDEKKKIYYEILNDVLELYYYYNSKTCVSITIVEMNAFFKLSQKYRCMKIITKKIKKIYSEYDTSETPNIILMNKIYNLIDLFKSNEKIKNILDLDIQLNTICDKL